MNPIQHHPIEGTKGHLQCGELPLYTLLSPTDRQGPNKTPHGTATIAKGKYSSLAPLLTRVGVRTTEALVGTKADEHSSPYLSTLLE